MESKGDIARRLQKRADWPDIEAEKDQLIKANRAEGHNRESASQKAWQTMAEKYPPEPEPPPPEIPPNKPQTPVAEYQPDLDSADYIPGVEWVYRSLRTTATAGDAPDPGAAGLLEWARENSDAFYQRVWPQAMALKAKQDTGTADEQAIEESEDCEAMGLLIGDVVGESGFLASPG